MNKHPKRLIEVDFPIKQISEHARKEKSVGTISSLHLWWARKPLAACRAIILSSFLMDPVDPKCPDKYVHAVKDCLVKWSKNHISKISDESSNLFIKIGKNPKLLKDLYTLRKALLFFIADFASKKNSNDKDYLETGRYLVKISYDFVSGIDNSIPLLIDPFAGGGSIPLEVLRLGGDTIASDINPVAVILNKVILEYIPKYGNRLNTELDRQLKWIKKRTKKSLSNLYENDPDGSVPIAYIWSRIVICEGPNCGASIPMLTSCWIANTKNETVGLKILPDSNKKTIDFKLVTSEKNISKGTTYRSSATCPICGYTTSRDRVQEQLLKQDGGAKTSRLIAVVLKYPGKTGRTYRLANENDKNQIKKAKKLLLKLVKEEKKAVLTEIPHEELPYLRSIFNVNIYGMQEWQHLFNSRQLLTMVYLVRAVRKMHSKYIQETDDLEFAKAVTTTISLSVSRTADHLNSCCSWNPKGPKLQHLFTRQAMGMIWDYAEANPFGGSVGDYSSWLSLWKVASEWASSSYGTGQALLSSACSHPAPDDSCDFIVTDPPYYDAVPYANLSDFFYVWLRRMLFDIHPDIFKTPLVMKEEEIAQLAERNKKYSYKTKEFFEEKMRVALADCKRIIKPNGILVVFFAHKGTSAWESLLKAVIDSGWMITASWPIDTEMRTRLRAMNSAVFASTIELVCRPRGSERGNSTNNFGDWRDILIELPKRINQWLPKLAKEGVVGADAIFSCIGPALEIFSRYSSVEKASGEKVELKEYLEQVWAAVAKEALKMIFEGADASGFEEDARLTAMWLWTLRTNFNDNENGVSGEGKTTNIAGYTLEFDAARKIAQGLGAHLENLGHLVETKGDKAILLSAGIRTPYLFGKDAGDAPKGRKKKKSKQMTFDFAEELKQIEDGSDDWSGDLSGRPGGTVLDQLHQSMILFGAGRGEALKRFLVEDGIGRNPLYWRLAQALSALYPSGTDEKRWVDGVLARKKSFGF